MMESPLCPKRQICSLASGDERTMKNEARIKSQRRQVELLVPFKSQIKRHAKQDTIKKGLLRFI